jgi:putative membrane protein
VAMIPLGAGFVLAQRAGTLGALARLVDRFLSGRLRVIQLRARDLDDALAALYARHRDVAACLGWQLAGWVLGAGELWLALHFLGAPRGVLDVVALEALIQAVSSAAFFVPAALGVQEGAFIVIGAALGLDAATALALATARRLRDVVVFLPGLLAWHRSEVRPRDSGSAEASR